MSDRLLSYETIIKAHKGDPEAIKAVLDRYAGYIRYFSKMNGHYNSDIEDYITTRLIESLSQGAPDFLSVQVTIALDALLMPLKGRLYYFDLTLKRVFYSFTLNLSCMISYFS